MKSSETDLSRIERRQSRRLSGCLACLGLFLLFLMSSHQTACAWDLELGIHHLMPKLWTGEQRYENASGSTLKFKPVIQKTITGQSASVGIFWENLLVQIEQAFYRYETEIPTSNIAVMNDTMARFEVTEQRLGISYHLERELAGVYAGIGVTREKEKIVTSSDEWQFEADVPYFKFGIDIILGAWRVRVEQIHYSFGKHSAKVGSLGILLHL